MTFNECLENARNHHPAMKGKGLVSFTPTEIDSLLLAFYLAGRLSAEEPDKVKPEDHFGRN